MREAEKPGRINARGRKGKERKNRDGGGNFRVFKRGLAVGTRGREVVTRKIDAPTHRKNCLRRVCEERRLR